jgi:hypothetical protein
VLVARKTPTRHDRFASRWLRCYVEEREGATLEEVAFVLGCLAALPGSGARGRASGTPEHYRGRGRKATCPDERLAARGGSAA